MDQVENVLGNDLIGEKIVSHLAYVDMKNASLTCSALFKMVRNSQCWSKKTVLSLGKNYGITSKLEDLYLNSEECWRNVKFNIMSSKEILIFLEKNPKLLENTTRVHLTRSSTTGGTAAYQMRIYEKLLLMIFHCGNKICELEIDLQLLMLHDFSAILQPEVCQKIRKLQIYETSCGEQDWDRRAIRNIEYFSITMKLESLQISGIGYNRVQSAILNLISDAGLALDSLDFIIGEYSSDVHVLNELVAVKSANIQVVLVPTEERLDVDGLVKFLENQPPLKNLTVNFNGKCPTVFLEYLQKKAESLVALKIETFYFETSTDWSFLANCSKLREFSISRRTDYHYYWKDPPGGFQATGVSILPWLPPTLKKMNFNLRHFWKLESDLRGDNIPEAEIVSLLSGFPALTYLYLGPDTVTDFMVQTIISKMPKLQEVGLSGDVTDFGLSGIKNGEVVGVSLAELTNLTDLSIYDCPGIASLPELRGLTHLSIYDCPGISPAALTSSVKNSAKLQDLRYEYKESRCNYFTDVQIKQLVAQNPALNRLFLHVSGEEALREKLTAELETNRVWKLLLLKGRPVSIYDEYDEVYEDTS